MAIILNDNIQVNLGKPVDNKYLQPILNRPYSAETEVNSTIIEALRYIGLTVNINNVEYWYVGGVTDTNLVVKTAGGTGERIEKDILQFHSFVIGDVLGYDDTLNQYRKVVSKTVETIEPVGMVSAVEGTSGFTIVFAGYVNGISGITDVATALPVVGNTVYYLSSTVDGRLTSTQPTEVGDVSKPVLTTFENYDGMVFQYRGGEISTGTTSGGTITASGERIEKNIVQTNSFSIGDVVGYSGGTYIPALAHIDFDGEIHGIISEATGVDFTVVYAGYVTGMTSAGLSSGTTYFASDTVLGGLQATQPTAINSIIKPMLSVSANVDEALVFQYLGVTVVTGVTDTAITGGTNVGLDYPRGEVFKEVSGLTMTFRTIIGSGGTIVDTSGDTIIVKAAGGLTEVVVNTGDTLYNATNLDDFIGISGLSSPTVALPTVPDIGKEITVSDVEGNALSSNITVQGDVFHTIEGATFSTINTDYGSITVLWNGFTWSITSFKT